MPSGLQRRINMDRFCEERVYSCCPEYAEFRYKNKNYCEDCLLLALEREKEIESYDYTVSVYSFAGGDYIGEDKEGVDDIIDSVLSNIKDIEVISD